MVVPLFDLRAVYRGNNELILAPWNKTLKYLNYFLPGFYSKVGNLHVAQNNFEIGAFLHVEPITSYFHQHVEPITSYFLHITSV
jgi:hypothetical protein